MAQPMQEINVDDHVSTNSRELFTHYQTKQLERLAKYQKQAHEAGNVNDVAASGFSRLHRWTSVGNIILTSLTALVSFFNVGYECGDNNLIASVTIVFLSTASSILSGVIAVYNFSSRGYGHDVIAQEYHSLADYITSLLALPDGRGEDIEQVFTELNLKFDSAGKRTPPIPGWAARLMKLK